MIYFTIILIIIVLAGVLFWWVRREHINEDESDSKTGQPRTGIGAVVLARSLRKEANKRKILNLLKTHKELTNAEVREGLGVASRTAVKYMDELERQGRIKQVGKSGRNVKYRIK